MGKGFRDFVLRGNVVDLAVAVVVGTAFGAVVTAFTSQVIQPLLNALGGVDATGLGFTIHPGNTATFVDVGAVVTAAVNFLIIAAAVYFLVVLPVNRLLALRKEGAVQEPAAPPEDVLLLQEIRDLLAERGGQQR